MNCTCAAAPHKFTNVIKIFDIAAQMCYTLTEIMPFDTIRGTGYPFTPKLRKQKGTLK